MKSIKSIDDLKNNFSVCMHALGAYKGIEYSNTLEPFEYWYNKGKRIFEVDIGPTEDKKFVAIAHAVNEMFMVRQHVLDKPTVYSYEWFTKQRLYGILGKGLTPLSLDNLLSMLSKYEDVIFMMDVYGIDSAEFLKLFLSELDKSITNDSLYDRFILEIYDIEYAEIIKEFNSKINVMICEDSGKTSSPQTLLDNGISIISYPWRYTRKEQKWSIEDYAKAGITVFSLTKTNLNNKKLKEKGVSVNIVNYCFDAKKIFYQLPVYAFRK